jgi:excisionase family DNA binding protein
MDGDKETGGGTVVQLVPLLLLTKAQAAKALSVCERTLDDLVKYHGVLRVKIGRSVRYRVSDLEQWICAQPSG